MLRTSGRHTLRLADSLAEDGFEVWTPSEKQRYPGNKAKRLVPIMPTFVFANAARLRDLLELADTPTKRHDDFSLFRHYDRIPLIDDAELAALRIAEARSAPRDEWPAFDRDQGVRATEGAWCGYSGRVVRSRGEWALVLFDSRRVKISCFHLQPIAPISTGQALRRDAA